MRLDRDTTPSMDDHMLYPTHNDQASHDALYQRLSEEAMDAYDEFIELANNENVDQEFRNLRLIADGYTGLLDAGPQRPCP